MSLGVAREMAMKLAWLTIVGVLALLGGCATKLTPEASQLRSITEADKRTCQFIKLIPEGAGARGSISENTKSATNTALNEVARAGGDSYFFVSSSSTTMGTSVIVE